MNVSFARDDCRQCGSLTAVWTMSQMTAKTRLKPGNGHPDLFSFQPSDDFFLGACLISALLGGVSASIKLQYPFRAAKHVLVNRSTSRV